MLQPGTIIGSRYQVVRLLGQGGMSNIYICRDTRLGNKIWAVKEFTARFQDPNEQATALAHFKLEADLLAHLSHPNLPTVNDYFPENGKYYLVMDYIQGEDLGKILEKNAGPLPEQQVAEWFVQIASVLYYLHCQKPEPIIFRDVKPSNIIICNNQVKLIDFGIARHFAPNKKNDTMRIGSPGYAPPEQYSKQTDARSDIFALGVTLHQAVTGRDPTASPSPFNIPPAKTINPNVSDAMAAIIEKATKLIPEARYQTMIELKRDLQALLGTRRGATTPNLVIPGVVGTVPGLQPQPAAGVSGNYHFANNPSSSNNNATANASSSGNQGGNNSAAPVAQQPGSSSGYVPGQKLFTKPSAANKGHRTSKKGFFTFSRVMALVLILAGIVLGVIIFFYPQQSKRFGQDLYHRLYAVLTTSGIQATNEGIDNYLHGADLEASWQLLQQELEQTKAVLQDKKQAAPASSWLTYAVTQIYINNALAQLIVNDETFAAANVDSSADSTSPTPELLYIGVVYPEPKDTNDYVGYSTLTGIAAAQATINRQGGINSHRLVLVLEAYAPGEMRSAIAKIAQGKSGRRAATMADPTLKPVSSILAIEANTQTGQAKSDPNENQDEKLNDSEIPLYILKLGSEHLSIHGPFGRNTTVQTLAPSSPLLAMLKGRQSSTVLTSSPTLANALRASFPGLQTLSPERLAQNKQLNKPANLYLFSLDGSAKQLASKTEGKPSLRTKVVILALKPAQLPSLEQLPFTVPQLQQLQAWVSLSPFHPSLLGQSAYLAPLELPSRIANEQELPTAPAWLQAYDSLSWLGIAEEKKLDRNMDYGNYSFQGATCTVQGDRLLPVAYQVYDYLQEAWILPRTEPVSDAHATPKASSESKDK